MRIFNRCEKTILDDNKYAIDIYHQTNLMYPLVKKRFIIVDDDITILLNWLIEDSFNMDMLRALNVEGIDVLEEFIKLRND